MHSAWTVAIIVKFVPKRVKKKIEKRKRGPKRNLSGLAVALLINAI